MALSTGNRLGPYEIVAPIGAGGMGEVYRARDPRIGRDVAIKVLPASFAKDEDRMQRFEREARAAGTLNHPNLVTIHEFGSHEGSPYIVMELLEGETLRARLTDPATAMGRTLPARKVVEYGVAIAGGLAAAHDKEIVHRDLKPDNIFITRDGRVKILDFGLAKLSGPMDLDGSQKLTAELQTTPGTVMGTAGYMSPEQVRGLPSDHRSDIFSFGAILYEMLTGRGAFRRDSAVETMNAILTVDPPEIARESGSISPDWSGSSGGVSRRSASSASSRRETRLSRWRRWRVLLEAARLLSRHFRRPRDAGWGCWRRPSPPPSSRWQLSSSGGCFPLRRSTPHRPPSRFISPS